MRKEVIIMSNKDKWFSLSEEDRLTIAAAFKQFINEEINEKQFASIVNSTSAVYKCPIVYFENMEKAQNYEFTNKDVYGFTLHVNNEEFNLFYDRYVIETLANNGDEESKNILEHVERKQIP